MKNRYLFYLLFILFIIALSAVQNYIVKLLEIYIWKPDILLIFIFIMGHIYGKRQGNLFGFISGLIENFFSGFGISLLAKSISGFISGFFRFNPTYNYTNFIYGILVTSLIHNTIFYTIYFYGDKSFFSLLTTYVIPNALYTSILAFLGYLAFEKKVAKYYAEQEQQ
jgi:rod shape-determining protein MreD